MNALAVTDLSIIDGDARVSSAKIAKVLGYDTAENLHVLIKRHFGEIETYGAVPRQTVGKREVVWRQLDAKPQVGRPALVYMLNEGQAVLVCMFSRTARAAAVRRMIVEVFTAWRRGDPLPPRPMPVEADPFRAAAERVAHVTDVLDGLTGLDARILQITHLPIWKNGRRPRWWHDIEVRTFVTLAHRQMSTLEAERQAIGRFGPARAPRKSSIHSYWMRLDEACGAVRPKRRLS